MKPFEIVFLAIDILLLLIIVVTFVRLMFTHDPLKKKDKK